MNAQRRKKRRQAQACIIHSGTTRYVLYFVKDKGRGSWIAARRVRRCVRSWPPNTNCEPSKDQMRAEKE